ncbi:MAG: Cu(I)/Ag(I) efflux system membrane fusion protein [Arenicella sp.]|jgi:Cu(I)/Ag(I) efflux system membrane fusion protein
MKSKHIIGLLILTLLLSACEDASKGVNTVENQDSHAPLAEYTCPMHPHYIATDPDGSCPICGMTLVPVNNNTSSNAKVAQDDTISVSGAMIQTMGVRTSPAEITEFGQTLRAFGTVEADQRLENVSVSRLEGWIDDLSVRAKGDAVRNGDLLYRVYSPDLLSAQRDYLSALTSGNVKRVKSVKQRLLSIGMQEQPLQQLTQRKTVIDKVPVYAETDGIVAELHVRNGDYLKPGTPVLRLQSYSKVWVIASIPETDLPLIDRGISAKLRFPSAPKAPSKGKVDYIYPTIDPKTRTAKVRIELDNSEGDLQPGAYADITLGFAKQARLSIVSEAILRDSRGGHVILALGDGRFGTRSVTTGITAEGRTEILSGLGVGDLVVSSGQFMLDSEVNLREGLSKLSASVADPAPLVDSTMSLTVMVAEASLSAIKVDATSLAQIDHLIDMALYFYTSLNNNDAINPSFVDPAIALVDNLAVRYHGTKLLSVLDQSKLALVSAQASLRGQALAAELANLMQAITPWILEGAPQHYSDLGLTLHRDIIGGQLWLHKGGVVENPYGDGESELIPWSQVIDGLAPDSSGLDSSGLDSSEIDSSEIDPVENTERVKDPHAGHR